MLPLPKLNIERDLEEEKKLLAATRQYIEKDTRVGIHMSDLQNLRLAYWRKVTKAPIPDRLINIFMVGQIAHAIIEVVKGGEGDYTKPPDSGTKCFEDLYYSPDFLNLHGEPDEIKTTRSFYPPKVPYLPDDDTYHMYLEQLVGYMAAEDKTVGRLTLLYLNMRDPDTHETAPQFYIWKVECSPEQLASYRKLLGIRKKQLETALQNMDHRDLPLCRKWLCEKCEFFQDLCKPEGRYGRDKKEWV